MFQVFTIYKGLHELYDEFESEDEADATADNLGNAYVEEKDE